MCYSAQCWQAYKEHVREFGAIVDIHEFALLYGYRKLNRKTKIPKGMDLQFLNPQSPLEQEIHDLIQEWNAEKISESEQELFKQVRRLADAERKLAVKETKAALTDQRVSRNKITQLKRWIADAKRTTHEPARDDRMFPDWYVPLLIVEDGKKIVRPMRYHCRLPGMPPSSDKTRDGKVSGTYNARRDNLTRYWRNQFGHSHGLMLADTFYEQVDDGKGGSKEIHFRPRTGERMYVPCLWAKWSDPEGKEPALYSFAAITDEPEPEVAAQGHDRTVINIKPEHMEAWLNPDPNNLKAMFDIFDDKQHPYYEVIREAA